MEDLACLWLLTQQTLKLPPAAFRRVVAHTANPRDLLNLPPDTRTALLLSKQHLDKLNRVLARRHADQDLQSDLQRAKVGILCRHSDNYPPLLKEIYDAPPLLYFRGRSELLTNPLFALVGSRRPSRTGRSDAEAFARALSEVGMTVVSGMALGVDGAAHCGALIGGGSTIAVLGTGVDQCYPRSNASLYERIAHEGLLISELPVGSPPMRHQFPRRNRIISGMSLGVLVVEAALRSGSLITARQALEQNREVFAIPGSIHNPASRGCNSLIKQGAKLVEQLDDILEEFAGWLDSAPSSACGHTANASAVDIETSSPIYQALGFEPVDIDTLAQNLGLPISELLSLLSDLEVEGWVEQFRGAWQRSR